MYTRVSGGPNAQRTYEPGRTRQGPTRQEVEDYARFLGMDPDDAEDQQLMWIAREGLTEPLPKFWRLCHRESDGAPYYFHVKNGDSQWDHPLDKKYRDMFKEYRSRSRRGPGGYVDDEDEERASRAGSRRGGSRQGSRSGSRRGGSRQGSRSSRYGDDGPAAQLASSGGRTRIGPDGSKMIEVGEILDEHVDVNFMPTEEDVYNYAAELGFDVDGDQHLLWIARNGLRKPMPKEWKAIKSRDNRIYYFNTSTGKSQWEHPIDQECRRIYEQEKFAEGQAAYLQTRLRGDGNLVGPGASQHVQYQQQQQASSSRGRNKDVERQQLAAYGRAGTQPQHNPGGWSHDGSYQRAAYYRNQSDPPHVQAHSNRAPVASRPYDGHGSRSTWSNPTPPPPAYEQPGYKGQPQPYGAPPDPRNPRRGAGEPGAPYRVNNAQPQSSLRGSRSRGGGQSSRGWSGESEWESSSSRGHRSRRRRSER